MKNTLYQKKELAHLKNDRSIGFTNPENKKIANCILAGYYKYPTDAEYIVHSLYPRSSKTGKGGTGQLSKSDGTTYCLDTGNSQAIEKTEQNKKINAFRVLEIARVY